MIMDSKLSHDLKAWSPMSVTELGIMMDGNAHPQNAHSFISVTEEGMVTEVNLLHPSNAEIPMQVTG